MSTEPRGSVPLQPSEAIYLLVVRLRRVEARGTKQQTYIMAIIKRDPITYQIAFGRMLKADKLKRYVLDWFTDLLRHRSIDPHRIEKAELVITLSPDDIEAFASELDRYRETICAWSTEVFGKEATLHIATDGGTENKWMEIRLCLKLNEE